MTLAEIKNTRELDLQIIRAAALLESDLRKQITADPGETLGALVQNIALFQKNSFIRDLNFALKVRNKIAHWTDQPSTESEKERAVDYLVQAIHLLRGTAQQVSKPRRSIARGIPGKRKLAAKKSMRFDSEAFDASATAASLAQIRRKSRHGAWAFAAILSLLVFVAQHWASGNLGEALWITYGGYAGYGFACLVFLAGFDSGSLTRANYYGVVGSKFANGDHRCIHCGHRGRDGRGIYTHGKYKSDTKFHECSKCKELLFTS